ncbi:MAG: NYN domain-containing protein [Chloroflexi bacterium]|nr:NYN domain-containing protein [Chloroflexota bacterium]
MKANAYIDGFNFYYGAVRRTPYKWLDFSRLCQLLLRGDTVNRIRYFTAIVDSRPDDPQKTSRQLTYLRALETIPGLSVHLGHFLTQEVTRPLADPPLEGPQYVRVINTEEKGSDVNLASHLLMDGIAQDYELAVVFSNDSDLMLPISMVCNDLGLKVGIFNPHKNVSRALRAIPNLLFYRPVRSWSLRDSQFPESLTDANGTVTKPATW